MEFFTKLLTNKKFICIINATQYKEEEGERMEENEINENMTIKEVADRMARSEQWVRLGLQQKSLPFRKCSAK